MGLAASQVRLQALTSESHNNNLRLLQLTMAKRTLANEMQAVSRKYQNALSSKKMQWTNNAGVTYSDISYSILMRPNANNAKSPVLLTDCSGKVIVDGKYKKYAEMISPNGTSLGSYSGSTRTAILSELTGISAEEIDNADKMSLFRDNSETQLTAEEDAFYNWLDTEDKTRGAGTKYLTVDKLAEYMGKASNGKDLAKLYKENGVIKFRTKNELKSYIENIGTNLGKYFLDDKIIGCTDNTKLKEACDAAYNIYDKAIDNGEVDKATYDVFGVEIEGEGYKVNVQDLFKMIMENYKGTSKENSSNTNEKTYPLRDKNSASWKTWYAELETKYAAMKTASDDYEFANDVANTSMTADQESKIQYYDDLFRAIADNGWTYDSQINDNDYLNQMLQNNAFYLTTMSKNDCYDDTIPEDGRNWNYEYDTTLASTFDHIITVNDSDIAAKALAEYEAEKRQISDKESRIDLKMEDLETQQAAIKETIESLKKMRNDNIDRTFKLWS